MHTPIGIGLIGVGRHGMRYARHIVQDLPQAMLTAVCRRNPDQPLDFPGANTVHLYGTPRELIADPSVQAVVVVVPPVYACEIARWAVQAHKPLLIEKPLAASHDDARAIAQAATAAQLPLMTAHTLRFDPVIQAVRAHRTAIGRSQQITLVSHIQTKGRGADHAEGYGNRGALMEFGVHMLDLVRFLTGEEIRRARCTMCPPPSSPDTTAAIDLTTNGETCCRIEIARVPDGRVGRMTWVGSGGQIDADWIGRRIRLSSDTAQREEQHIPPTPTVLAVLTAFLEALATRAPMPITGEDGRRAVEIAEACYRSAQAGGIPINLPLTD